VTSCYDSYWRCDKSAVVPMNGQTGAATANLTSAPVNEGVGHEIDYKDEGKEKAAAEDKRDGNGDVLKAPTEDDNEEDKENALAA
jgi:hypothetical protein